MLSSKLNAAALCLFVAGCGGGGSSDPTPAPAPAAAPAPAPARTISGSLGADGSNATITLSPGGTTISVAPDGRYSIEGLVPGTYTITPGDGFHSFDPPIRTIAVGSANVAGQDFAALSTGDGMTEAELQIESAAPEALITTNEILLPNGQTLTQYRASRPASGDNRSRALAVGSLTGAAAVTEAIAVMLESARDYACTRNPSDPCKPVGKWNHDAEPDIVAVLGTGSASTKATYKRPSQVGLAYVFGSRTVATRVRPIPVCSADNLLLYGTDCSGLINLITTAAGIGFKKPGNITVETQINISNWDIPAEWGVEFKEITDGNYKAGDIVFMRGHVGISQNDGRDPVIISSTGSGVTRSWCTNENLRKGPRSVLLSKLPSALNKAFRLAPKGTVVSAYKDFGLGFSATTTSACVTRYANGALAGRVDLAASTPSMNIDFQGGLGPYKDLVSNPPPSGDQCYYGAGIYVINGSIPLTRVGNKFTGSTTLPFSPGSFCFTNTASGIANTNCSGGSVLFSVNLDLNQAANPISMTGNVSMKLKANAPGGVMEGLVLGPYEMRVGGYPPP